MSSVDPAALAASIMAMKAEAQGQNLAVAMVRKQAEAQSSVIDMIASATAQATNPAALPEGQGRQVDVTA